MIIPHLIPVIREQIFERLVFEIHEAYFIISNGGKSKLNLNAKWCGNNARLVKEHNITFEDYYETQRAATPYTTSLGDLFEITNPNYTVIHINGTIL